jgi:hypothetical protein
MKNSETPSGVEVKQAKGSKYCQESSLRKIKIPGRNRGNFKT